MQLIATVLLWMMAKMHGSTLTKDVTYAVVYDGDVLTSKATKVEVAKLISPFEKGDDKLEIARFSEFTTQWEKVDVVLF